MKFSLKSIFTTLAIGLTMTACNFGDNNGSSTSTVTYAATDLLMRLEAGGNVTAPEAPQVQAFLKTDNEGARISFTISSLRLKDNTISSLSIPEIKVTYTETGFEANQMIIPSSSVTIDNFSFKVVGNWMTMSMTVDNENVRLCSSWIWTGQQLYSVNYDFDSANSNKKLVLLGGTSNIINQDAGTTNENKSIEYGIVFDQKNQKADVYSFFTPLDGVESSAKTYLFEGIPYTLDSGGISLQSDGEIAAKTVTRYATTEAPEIKLSSLSAFIPYNGTKGNIRYVVTENGNDITIACSPMEIVQQLQMH